MNLHDCIDALNAINEEERRGLGCYLRSGENAESLRYAIARYEAKISLFSAIVRLSKSAESDDAYKECMKAQEAARHRVYRPHRPRHWWQWPVYWNECFYS